jgi:hypothetical protein
MPASSAADVYDGTIPFRDTGAGSLPLGGPAQVAVTSVIAVIPLAGLAVAIWLARRRAASPGPEDAPAADEVAGTPGSEPERAPAPAAR